jgi:hypothetical protein
MRIKHVWWVALAAWGILSFFGVPLPKDWKSATPWLTYLETFARDHVAYPMMCGLVIGLTFGTVIIPEAWALFRESERKKKAEIDSYLKASDGVRITSTVGGPLSKWIGIDVAAATEASLIDCEVLLLSITRLHDDETKEVLAGEPVWCEWGNRPERKIEIAHGIPWPANFFAVGEASPTTLVVRTAPGKPSIIRGVQAPGQFRLKVGIQAKGAKADIRSYRFVWGGSYDGEIRLIQE